MTLGDDSYKRKRKSNPSFLESRASQPVCAFVSTSIIAFYPITLAIWLSHCIGSIVPTVFSSKSFTICWLLIINISPQMFPSLIILLVTSSVWFSSCIVQCDHGIFCFPCFSCSVFITSSTCSKVLSTFACYSSLN